MLPFPASPWWSLCSGSFLWPLGRARSCWGRNCRRLAWETRCWVFLPPYSVSTSGSRSCYEGQSRNFTACCGLFTLLGDPNRGHDGMLVGGTCISWACCLQMCIIPLWICWYHSPEVSHGLLFQMFAASHALACVCFKSISPSFTYPLLVLALRDLVTSGSTFTLPITFMVLWTLSVFPQTSCL